MAVRFSGSFKPWLDEGEDIDIEVEDFEGGGNLPIRIVGFHTFTEGESRDPMTVMNPQRCELTFLIEDESYEQIIQDLASAVNDRFAIRASSQSYTFFAGVVIHDFIDWPDLPYPYPFTLSATDGLTRMKDIDYLDKDTLDFYQDEQLDHFANLLTHLWNCFEKLNLENVYGSSFDVKRIWINCNWYATNMANFTDNPLSMIYVPYTLFYDVDNDGNKISHSCFEVMEAILTNLGMRAEYGLGIYRLEQLSEKTSGINTYWTYNFDGTPTGTRNQKWDWEVARSFENKRDANYPKATGSFSMLDPLRQVRVIYEYPLEGVAEEPDPTFGFGGTSVQKICYVYGGASNLRPVHLLSGDDIPNELRFRVHFQLMVKTSFTGAQADWLKHRYHIRIHLGVTSANGSNKSHYAYKQWITGYDPVTEEPTWNTHGDFGLASTIISNGWDYLTDPLWYLGSSPHPFYFDVGFETIEYPVSGEDLVLTYLCVELVDILVEDGSSGLPAGYGIEWAVSDLSVIVAKSDEKAKPTKKKQEFKSTITEGGKDSRDIKIRFSDKGNTLKVNDGSTLVSPGGWGVGGGGGIELGQLLAQEYHKVRGKPIRLMTRTIIGTTQRSCNNLVLFEYANQFWQSLESDHSYYPMEITGTWWAFEEAPQAPPATVTKLEIGLEYNRLDNKNNQPGLPPPNLEQLGRDGDGFTANADEFIFTPATLPDKTKNSPKAIREKLDVYINGVKSYYVETNPVGPQQFTINNVNNSISLDSNHPLSQRHVIWVLLKY